MDDADRQLLMELNQIGRALTTFGLAVIEGSVSRDAQIALGARLVNLAERIHGRAVKTPLVIEGDIDDAVRLPDTTVQPDWRP